MLLWFWKKGREILHVRCERWKALTVLWVHCTYLCVLEGKAPCGSHKEEGTVNRQIKQASSAFRECRAGRGRTHAPTGISETTQCSDHLRVPLPVPQSRALLTVGHFLLCDSAGLSLKPSIHRVPENWSWLTPKVFLFITDPPRYERGKLGDQITTMSITKWTQHGKYIMSYPPPLNNWSQDL